MSYTGRKLFRSRKQRILGGVCGGLGDYFGVDPTLIRLAWVIFCLVWGAGLIFYLIAWIVIPPAPDYVDVQPVPPGAPSTAATQGRPASSGYPGAFTIALAILGVILIVSGISTLFSPLFSAFSPYLLPAGLIVLGAIIVVAVLFLMRR